MDISHNILGQSNIKINFDITETVIGSGMGEKSVFVIRIKCYLKNTMKLTERLSPRGLHVRGGYLQRAVPAIFQKF